MSNSRCRSGSSASRARSAAALAWRPLYTLTWLLTTAPTIARAAATRSQNVRRVTMSPPRQDLFTGPCGCVPPGGTHEDSQSAPEAARAGRARPRADGRSIRGVDSVQSVRRPRRMRTFSTRDRKCSGPPTRIATVAFPARADASPGPRAPTEMQCAAARLGIEAAVESVTSVEGLMVGSWARAAVGGRLPQFSAVWRVHPRLCRKKRVNAHRIGRTGSRERPSRPDRRPSRAFRRPPRRA